MLFAKTALPQPVPVGLPCPIFSRAADSRLTLFTSPAGYFHSSQLAATLLNENARPTLWLRLGPEDADPATLLLSLVGAARRLRPEIGAATMERMRQQPGPVTGWLPLFASLGQELADGLPGATALVLEGVERLADASQTLDMLGTQLLPLLSDRTSCILITQAKIPTAGWPRYTIQRGVNEMRVDLLAASTLAQFSAAGLPPQSIERAVALTEGRGEVLAGLCAVAAESGAAFVQPVIDQARDLNDLLLRLAHAWLAMAPMGALQILALALAAHLEYSHPAMLHATLGNVTLPTSPLLQALEANWTRVPCLWSTALRQSVQPNSVDLHHLADYLASHEALELAVPLYVEIGETANAAQAIAKAAGAMIDLGQWQTLGHWLDRLAGQAPQKQERPEPAHLWSRLLAALGLPRRVADAPTPVEKVGQLAVGQPEGDASSPSETNPSTALTAIQQLPMQRAETPIPTPQPVGPAPLPESAPAAEAPPTNPPTLAAPPTMPWPTPPLEPAPAAEGLRPARLPRPCRHRRR